MPQHRVLLGSDERYDIDIYQFQLITPIKRNWALGIQVSREIMSGASPWGTTMGANEKPALIMSGATIRDSRLETAITFTRYFETSSTNITLSRSKEDDYTSKAITIGNDWEFGLGTLALGLSYSTDDIEPSEAALFNRVTDEKKRSRSFSAAWTQILNKTSLFQAGLSITKRWGFLADPYKLRDVRPSGRLEKTISARYRKFVQSLGVALHLDYRYFRDDFGIRSHTLEANWHQPVTESFKLIPSVRYYSQREADFYSVYDNFALPITASQSSDYRLSSYGAYAFGLKGVFNRDDWSIDLAVERYIASGDYGLDDPKLEHPALLSFNLVTLGVSYRF